MTGLAGSFLRPDDPSTLSVLGDLNFAGTMEFLYDGSARSARQQGCRYRQRECDRHNVDFTQIGTALTLPSYTILTYTGSWTGSPTATNLPAGYHVDTVSIPGQVNLMVPKLRPSYCWRWA